MAAMDGDGSDAPRRLSAIRPPLASRQGRPWWRRVAPSNAAPSQEASPARIRRRSPPRPGGACSIAPERPGPHLSPMV
jgi:hypothetical protein